MIVTALAAGISVVMGAQQGGSDPAPAIAEVVQKTDRAERGPGHVKGGDAKGAGSLQLAQALSLDPALMKRGSAGDTPGDAFEKKSWYVPPPPPPPVIAAPPPPPPPPTAPPLPFTFMGRYMESDKPVFFLTAGDRLLMVHAGEVIDGTYRVEGIVGNKLEITYLPLNTKQSLEVGSAG